MVHPVHTTIAKFWRNIPFNAAIEIPDLAVWKVGGFEIADVECEPRGRFIRPVRRARPSIHDLEASHGHVSMDSRLCPKRIDKAFSFRAERTAQRTEFDKGGV